MPDVLPRELAHVSSSLTLVGSRPNDVTLSPDGLIIYTSSGDGYVRAYNAETGVLMTRWKVGQSLGALDISLDGRFIVVTEQRPLAIRGEETTVTLYRLNVETGNVASFPHVATELDYTFYDVAALSDGKVLVTQLFNGSGWVELKLLDPKTGLYTDLGQVEGATLLSRSVDGSMVLIAEGTSSGMPLALYDVVDGLTVRGGGWGIARGLQAISEEAGLVALREWGVGIVIRDLNLETKVMLRDINPRWERGEFALSFDKTGSFLFVLDQGNDSIVQLSTSNWRIIQTIPIGIEIDYFGGGFGNNLLVGPDMRFFTVVTNNGLQRVDNPAVADAKAGTEAADTMKGTAGLDTLIGYGGNDVLSGLGADDVIFGLNNNDRLQGDDGNDVLDGGKGLDQLYGGSGSDELRGGADADLLDGGSGNDILDGGIAADDMRGGSGNDTYLVDDAGDKVFEASDKGTDTVRSSISYTLPANVEDLVLTGTARLNGTGNGHANTLTGNSGANLLNGAGGADMMQGRGGDDIFIVDNAGDQVIERTGEGADEIRASVSYKLAENVETLILTGTAAINGSGTSGADRITGNAAANTLSGGGGNDLLDGGMGADVLRGGVGHDTYIVDNSGDQVIELADQGNDMVRSYISYTLVDHVEILALGGSGVINGTGNSLANRLYGNAKANILDGAGGADTMQGRAGNDTYVVDNANDKVVELANEGVDTVRSSVSFSLPSHVENLYLTGTAAIDATGNSVGNRLVGNGAANQLNGAGGADTMQGRAGNDTYFVDHAGDAVIELANEGIDRVRSTISYTLPSHVENLTLDGNAAIDATGNSAANLLVGNRANNNLDGAGGADTMRGGAGNDTYVVDHVGDTVTELANEGTDRVKSAISYTLGDNVENLYLSGSEKIDGTGNALANKIVGNKVANTLKGEGGNDILVGGDGDDQLHGGSGTDMLEGGAGADRFSFDTALGSSNVDRIVDFVSGADKILLDDNIFSGLPAGVLANGAFVLGTAATGADHRIIYNPATGALLYDADGNGGAAAIQFATLDNQPDSLAASDFVVI